MRSDWSPGRVYNGGIRYDRLADGKSILFTWGKWYIWLKDHSWVIFMYENKGPQATPTEAMDAVDKFFKVNKEAK